MKQSRRARRMQRSHLRHGRTPAFNLVSLMDIFTILVFFLLVNSSDGEVLPSTRSVELPESISEEKPRHNVVVMVTEQDILVQGSRVASVEEVAVSEKTVVGSLQSALEAQKQRLLLPEGSDDASREVTIMGGKATPYHVLKKVMATCTEAGYGRISLAVLQKPIEES
jgi:biopolymer transport protein ExbD